MFYCFHGQGVTCDNCSSVARGPFANVPPLVVREVALPASLSDEDVERIAEAVTRKLRAKPAETTTFHGRVVPKPAKGGLRG